MNQEERKEFWAIVSLMGHQQLVGFLDEYTMGGCSFLRLTVPETSKQPQWSRLFKDNAIYSIDPCTEDVAKWKAERLSVAPISIWDAKEMLSKDLENTGKVVVSKDQLPEGFFLPAAKIVSIADDEQDEFFHGDYDGEDDDETRPF